MWNPYCEELANGHGLRFVIDLDASPASYAQILQRWQHDSGFRALFIDLLAGAPFASYRWETPPVTVATQDRAFEFVLWDSPELAVKSDPRTFDCQFGSDTNQRSVVTFPNLGNDAILVVPCPIGSLSAYAHLAAFVRQAPEPQKHALWERVGRVMAGRLSAAPVWLSTAGAGVSWLHVRLDDQPKYYRHRSYRDLV